MTERKPREISFASWIDQQVSEAAERGAFDNLPGAGKPISRRGGTDAWLQDYLRREGVSADELLPTPLRLRKEIERLTETVQDLHSEDEVRQVVKGLNRRIAEWRRIPDGPPVYLRLMDEDAMVTRWRDARRGPSAPAPPVPHPDPPPRRSRWWRHHQIIRAGLPERPRCQPGPVGQLQLGQGAPDVSLDGPRSRRPRRQFGARPQAGVVRGGPPRRGAAVGDGLASAGDDRGDESRGQCGVRAHGELEDTGGGAVGTLPPQEIAQAVRHEGVAEPAGPLQHVRVRADDDAGAGGGEPVRQRQLGLVRAGLALGAPVHEHDDDAGEPPGRPDGRQGAAQVDSVGLARAARCRHPG